MALQDVKNIVIKQRAEKAGINVDDDEDANPLLKRRTVEEMDVSNYTKAEAIGFASRLGVTDTVRGVSQLTGIGAEESKKEQLMLNQLMKNKEYGGYVTAAYFGGLMADPVGWAIPFAKARSIWKMAKYGMVTGGIAGATGYVDEELDSLVGDGKMTRTEQTMLGVVGGGTIAPLAGGIANVVKKVRGKPLIPLREKVIPEASKPVSIKETAAASDEFLDDVIKSSPKTPKITTDDVSKIGDDVNVKVKNNPDGSKTVSKLVDGEDYNVKLNNLKTLSPVQQFYKDLYEGNESVIARAVMQNPTGAIGGVTGGLIGYDKGVPWGEAEDDRNVLGKLTGALLGTAIGAVAGVNVKKIPLGGGDNLGDMVGRNFIDRFGMQQELKDGFLRLRADQGNFFGRVGDVFERMQKLGDEENKILYRMLVGEVSPASAKDIKLASIMDGLTDEQQIAKLNSLKELSKEGREAITELGQKMVDHGLIDERTFRENINTYLHRRYIQHEDLADKYIKDPKKRAAFTGTFRRAFSELRTNADELKPRGILFKVSPEEYVNFYSKKTSQDHLKNLAKTMGFDDLASAQKIEMRIMQEDAMHKGWEIFEKNVTRIKKKRNGQFVKVLEDGTEKAFEKGERLQIRWQLTKAQRLAMGEIEDASAAIFETGRLMASDLAITKFYNNVGKNVAESLEDLTAKNLTAKQIKNNYTLIPDTLVSGTEIKAYGDAAGKYVPNGVAYDLQEFNRYRNLIGGKGRTDLTMPGTAAAKTAESLKEHPVGRAFLRMQQIWKKTKTAYNPAVHTNNIMSNFVLFDLAIKGNNLGPINIGQYHAKYLKEAMSSLVNKDGLYKLAERQGVFSKDFLIQETSELNEYLNKIYGKAFDNAKDLNGAMAGMMNAARKGVDKLSTIPNGLEQLYRKEDHIFRLAIFKQRLDLARSAKVTDNVIEGGLELQQRTGRIFTDFEQDQLSKIIKGDVIDLDKAELKFVREVVDHATQQGIKWFINYDIQAPMINILRGTALPFLAYTYRVVPLLAEAAVTQPAKYAKWAALGFGLNMIGSNLGEGDEEAERRFMSERDQQKVFGMPFLPNRMVKVPVTIGGNPTYIDITRWTPGGDIFEMNQGSGQWPGLPQPLQPSFGGAGAVITTMVGYEPFTGQPIAGLGAPGWFDFNTKFTNLAYEFIPNIALIPGTYANQKVVRAFKEGETAYTDNLTPIQAILDTLGVKLKPANLEKLQARKVAEMNRKLEALQQQSSEIYSKYIKKTATLRDPTGYSKEDYLRDIKKIQKQREKIVKEYDEIFSYVFKEKKDDPLENGSWPLLTDDQIKKMNNNIYNYIEQNNMGITGGTTQ